MSGDGPTKATPAEALEPLDDIILGEDEETAPTPPVAPAPPPVPPKPTGSVRPPQTASLDLEADAAKAREKADKDKEKEKKRAKMTLRIPDDEVSRPQLPATTPMGGIAAISGSSPPPKPPEDEASAAITGKQTVRLRKFESPDDTLEMPARAIAAAPGVDPSTERGWTPYQPPVADANGSAKTSEPPAPPEVAPPTSEEIPVDLSDSDDDDVDDKTNPNMPSPLDSEDIKLDEGERVSDPGDAPEISAEDLVSVESIPSPNQEQRAGKTRAPMPSQPTAASLMGGLPPPTATPVQPAVAAKAPKAPAPSPSPSQPTASTPAPAPVATTPRAPLVFVPPVGALAPPPMNETAANRKKTRPWWEELFNDDYIRTMAKVTDPQIAKEVTFIEESLGCEAGAMVLDLACGTGRHAVELATRGYQVCGFDLSLSMLARASDEAQERGAKINFVQGDMREMTFEETFDGIYCWNTSFGFFDEEKNNAVIGRVHRALKKGGQFLLDVVNRDFIIRQAPSLAWFEGDGCICMDEMMIDFITSRMRVKRTLMMDDGRTKEIEYSIRIYSLHELGKLLHDNGFRVAEVSGRTSTPGVFFGCEAPRTLILAEKR